MPWTRYIHKFLREIKGILNDTYAELRVSDEMCILLL